VFGGDLGRASRSEQCIAKFLAAVGFREPPRGGIDEGEALDCGRCASRSPRTATAAKRCRLGMTRMPRGDRTIGSRRNQAPQPPTPASVTAPAHPDVAGPDGGRSVTPTSTPAIPGQPTEHARAPAGAPRSGLLALQNKCAAVQLHHLTMIEHHPESVWIEVHRVWHRVSTPSTGLAIKAGDRCSSSRVAPARWACRGLLGTGRARFPGNRLEQAPRAIRSGLQECWSCCQRRLVEGFGSGCG
jgi:hypothetical protein